jgi:hypothetical protein
VVDLAARVVWHPVCMTRRLGCVVLLGVCAVAAGCALATPTDGQERAVRAPRSFALYALSRGRGVPEATRTAWQAAWSLLEGARRDGKVARLEQIRIGLEGEMRLCAEFDDPQVAQEMVDRVRMIVRDVQLLNLVEEPCSGR